ncbi:Alkaline phosphatase [Enhygromyxa salina]|uniref:Alkaline phosphatase n=1 Tax=Enhygromyxa salina TaxID=215803 RepID=A0A0C2D4R8_9BACT|nr:hypothetical protein [Enhygromyxa salina]KIG15072.1 Alkaline phosphatase [Enhygromyxa salina]
MMIHETIPARIVLTLAFSILGLACADDPPPGGEGQDTQHTSDTDDSGDGDGESGDGDSDSESDSGDGDGDDSGDGDGDGDSGDGDGDTDSGGDGDAAVQEACATSCQVWSTCVFPWAECEQLCIEGYQELEGDCFDKTLALSMCQASLTCEEYIAYLDSEPGNACEAEEQAQLECDPS